VLVIQDGEFAWSRDARQPTLEGINVTVRKGELLGIWGPVGAGKVQYCYSCPLTLISDAIPSQTSVLSAICGEMIRLDGKVGIHGSIAYAPQTPWIMSGSIKYEVLLFVCQCTHSNVVHQGQHLVFT
jgi:ATP-binding cassette subfamily C (CFTR/MRP) protein 1